MQNLPGLNIRIRLAQTSCVLDQGCEPVEIQRGCHIGLHLEGVTRHRERHAIAGHLCAWDYVVYFGNQTQMHTCSTEYGDSCFDPGAIRSSAKRTTRQVQVAEHDRQPLGQACASGCSSR